METTHNKTVNRPATVSPAAAGPVVQRRAVSVQTSLKVSSPKDPAEKEADTTAKKVMRMAIPESSVGIVPTEGGKGVFRQINKDEKDKPKLLRSPYIARFLGTGIFTQPKKDDDKKPIVARFASTIATVKEDDKKQAIARAMDASVPVKDDKKKISRFSLGGIFTKNEPKEEQKVQRKPAEGQPGIASNVASDIQSSTSSGNPLPLSVRKFMEPRFNADFSKVKVHTDDKASKLNKQVSAQAFAVGNNVFFGKDKFKPDTHDGKELIAHELTHTIQQGGAVQRSEDASVSHQSPAQVQRLGISDVLDYFADKANNIPGFRMFTIILGVNPINMSSVDRSAANILRAVIEFIPGGNLITQALDNHGIIDKVANWVEKQIATLGMIGSSIKKGVSDFLDSLSWTDIFDLGGVWTRAKRIFTDPIDRIINFAKGLITGIIKFIKDAILRPLAKLAEGTQGYDLLKAVLGEDPVTGDPVPQTAETIIGGFMKLIGQEEIWENIKKGNAIAKAWTWFKTALSELMGFVRQIPQLFITAFTSLELMDIVLLPRAFIKVGKVFGSFFGKFLSWAGGTVLSLLEIIFTVVAPKVVPYLKKAASTFNIIIKNPIGFVGNLVRAGKKGFQMFADNIGEHLKNALIKWLTGPLGEAGVYIPKSFTLMEVIKFVLSVLGLTWQNIRTKLLKIIPEPVLVLLEKTASVLVTLVKDGPAAAWEQIKAELTEMKDQLISQVIQMVTTEIVKAAVIKLVSMINPAGAVIQAIIAIYNTVTFFIQKINQIAAVVASFIDSVAAIAAGQVDAAAKKVEQTMANTLVIVIGFLAKFAGLGNVPEKLVGIVKKIRKPIDTGLDKIVAWLGEMLKKIGGAVKAGVKKLMNWWTKKVPVNAGDEKHTLTFEGSQKDSKLVLRSDPEKPSEFLGKAAVKKKVPDDKKAGPIATAKTQEKAIEDILTILKAYDEAKATPAGPEEKKANDKATELDGKMSTLGAHIVTTLNDWGAADAEIKGISLPRGSFSVEQKRGIAAQHPNKDQLKENSDGELINLGLDDKGEKLARRHIVSSYDMSKHYEERLNGKKVSEGKLLIEQRASIADARVPVTDVSVAGIQEAAKTRYSKFFGYLRNMFVGNSRENSSIQEYIDKGKPGMAEQQLKEHVSHVKRSWAFDQDMKISGLDET